MDIASSEWDGPQDEIIGWWRSHMPAADSRKLKPAPTGVLLDTLADLVDRAGKEELAFLLALLLVRRRVLVERETLDVNEVYRRFPTGSLSAMQTNGCGMCPIVHHRLKRWSTFRMN